jgi:hypothetical protein
MKAKYRSGTKVKNIFSVFVKRAKRVLPLKKIISFCVHSSYWLVGLVTVATIFFEFQVPHLEISRAMTCQP